MEREGGLINRKRVLAAAVLLLLVALLVFLLWWWFWRGSGADDVGPTSTPLVEDKVILPPNKQTVNAPVNQPAAQPSLGELYITNLARNFAERYGSFSTDRSFQNLIDVMPLSTPSLKTTFEAIIASSPGGSAATFKGVETRALTITIMSLTASRAEVEVVAQRTETDVDLNKTTTYQTLDLSILQLGEFWYVDEAAWREKLIIYD